jgi:hypothetical protein
MIPSAERSGLNGYLKLHMAARWCIGGKVDDIPRRSLPATASSWVCTTPSATMLA